MDSDIELRLKTNLATAHSYYDQVVAVSQKIINDDFEALVKVYPEMSTMLFEDPMVGSISGTLLAPRILLGGGEGADLNISQCLYQMRFQSGKLLNSQYKIDLDLAGWELAVKVDLGKQSIKVDPDADPDTQAEQQKWVDFMNSRFAIPGDYSIERLMAKITDAEWDAFDYNNSNFGKNDDGTKRSWAQFKKKYKQMELRLPLMLKEWAQTQEERGLTTLGVKFTLPPATKIDPLAPTYKPTAMYHQVFPYINPKKGVPDPVISYGPPGDSNALLYCEMVEGHELPRDKQLASTGVFTTQATQIGGSRIDGTFALSHQMFLGAFLLPKLQVFNKATDIIPEPGSTTFDGGNSSIGVRYSVGYDDKHPNADDDVFKLLPNNAVDPTSYTFTKKNSSKLEGQPVKSPDRNIWLGQDSIGESNVKFTWSPGGTKFTLSGGTTYSYNSQWFENDQQRDAYAWARINWRVEWSLSISIDSVAGGAMKFKLDGGPNNDANLNVTLVSVDRRGSKPGTPDQDGRIKDEIGTYLKQHVKWLNSELLKLFDSTGKFVYPGNGTFDFANPAIGYTGEILADINYKPPVRDGGKIAVPLPGGQKAQKPKQFAKVEIAIQSSSQTPDARLSWSASKTLKSAESAQPSLLLVTGKNETTAALKFKNVNFEFDSVDAGGSVMVLKELNEGPTSANSPLITPVKRFDAKKSINLFEALVPKHAGKYNATCERNPPDGTTANASYTLNISAVDPYITVQPGESISLAIRGRAGVPGTYVINVTEQWEKKDMSSKNFWGSLVEPVFVAVSP